MSVPRVSYVINTHISYSLIPNQLIIKWTTISVGVPGACTVCLLCCVLSCMYCTVTDRERGWGCERLCESQHVKVLRRSEMEIQRVRSVRIPLLEVP